MDSDAVGGDGGACSSGGLSSPFPVISSGDERPLSAAALSSLASFLSGVGGRSSANVAASAGSGNASYRRLAASMDSDDSASTNPLLAAKCYLLLLRSSHSSSSSPLFDPLPFISFLRCLRRTVKRAQPSLSPVVAKSKRKRKHGCAETKKNSGGIDSARKVALEIVELLVDVLEKIALEMHPDARKSLTETMIVLLLSTTVDARVREKCFKGLSIVIERRQHGERQFTVVEVLRALAPLMLMERKVGLRNEAIEFVTKKVRDLGREDQGVYEALVSLPQFLAMKAPEKVEMRVHAVEVIIEVLKVLEIDDRLRFVDFVVNMTKGKVRLRLLAVDLILGLFGAMENPFRDGEGSWGMKCLSALVERSSDSVGNIRARALLNLSHVVDMLSNRAEVATLVERAVIGRNGGYTSLLRRRCADEKAAVRKAALVLISKSIAWIANPLDESLLKTMGSACSDPLVSIRKAALAAISEVFRKLSDDRVIGEWLHSVPPLIADNETSIQDECATLFMELVFTRINQVGDIKLNYKLKDTELLLPEGILTILKFISNGDVQPCIRKICSSLGKKRKFKPSLVKSLQNIIATSESLWLRDSKPINQWTAPPGAWWLLAEISLFAPKAVDWDFLLHHWQLLDNVSDSGIPIRGELDSASWAGDRVSLLQTISNVSVELPAEPAAELEHNLLTRIENFDMHLSEVDAHVKALKTLCKRKGKTDEEGNILKWVQKLLSRAFDILDGYVKEVSQTMKGDTFFTPSPKRNLNRKEDMPGSLLTAVTAVFTIGSLVLACPGANLQGIVPLLHTIITSANPEPKPRKMAGLTISFNEVAPPLYIQSWSAMAKICLVDDKLAKRYIPLFVQELETSDLAALRNNLMVAMSDFCVRYTALVDCYISKITKCLRDPCEVVRRQTFILLSKLLQRDYVKWRGVLFLRFLPSLVDPSEKIRHLADYLFGSILKAKAPLLAYNSFIEAIYVLNNCQGHADSSEARSSIDKLFAMSGTDARSRSQRMQIYVCLLKQMAPEHLLATSAKLCAEILAGACDGLLSIDDAAGRAVLQDVLQILASKEMRIHPSIGIDNTEMDDDGVDPASSAALSAAKGRAVTQVAKKNLIQIAVPIFIELKRLLESKNSPLTGALMECLRALLKDYKNEIDEILVADKQLQKEILYDMQKYEANKAKARVAERSVDHRSPPPTRHVDKAIGSAMADKAARTTVRTVLKELNRNAGTPPLCMMSLPKVKPAGVNGDASGAPASGRHSPHVLQSLRRRYAFESDEDS